ncbi:MAG: hypothetical protein A4E73_01946 [Syntrophaceae bacterium PtaU1.Bin231]|nr:MAG: hypothetical protein A4E73_01946 [Syntrophaceae bacterium PtaU1.Bin231]
MASQRGGAGGLHAGRSASDHHDFLPHLRFPDGGILALPPRKGIDGAPYGVRRMDGYAAFVAGETLPDFIDPSLLHFQGPFRIGDEGSPQPDEIALAVPQDLFRQFGFVQPPHGHHGDSDRFLDGFRHVHQAAPLHIVGGHRGNPGAVYADGAAQTAHPRFFQHLGDLLGFLHVPAAGDEFVDGIFHRDGETGARRFLHRRHDFHQEPASSFQAASVFVRSLVEVGGHELCDEIALVGMDLDHVEPGPLYAACRVSAEFDAFFYFFDGQDPRLLHGSMHGGAVGRNPGRRYLLDVLSPLETGQPGAAACLGAASGGQLYADFRPVFVDGIRQAGQAGDEGVVVRPQNARKQSPGIDGGLGHADLDHDEPRPASGPDRIPVDQPLGHFTPLPAEDGPHGEHHDPVLQLQCPQFPGAKQIFEFHCPAPFRTAAADVFLT